MVIRSLFFYIWRMNTKWIYGILLLVFAVTGIYQNRISVPNQQIVLQFEDNATLIEDTILQVTSQLHAAGASHIQIVTNEQSDVTITYYSASDVAYIEAFLFNEGITSKELPYKTNSKKSKELIWNVSEIQSTQNNAWDFEGTTVTEYKPASDRFISQDYTLGGILNSECLAIGSQYLSSIATDVLCYYKIRWDHHSPLVRAGPNS